MSALDDLIQLLMDLPGVGEKTAQRLAFYVLRAPEDYAFRLSQMIRDVKAKIGFCKLCQDLTEGSLCRICQDQHRDPSLLCIVEASSAMTALERTGQYRGRYHILHGSLSPLQSIGPAELHLDRLKERLRHQNEIHEVILALNSDPEGEATAHYLREYLGDLSVRVTKIASGVPVGAHIEYADPITLTRALEARA